MLVTHLAAARTRDLDLSHPGFNRARRSPVDAELQVGDNDGRRRRVQLFVKPAPKQLAALAVTASKLATGMILGAVDSCRSSSG